MVEGSGKDLTVREIRRNFLMREVKGICGERD